MKKLLIALFVVSLAGCGTVDTVKKYWPRDHDPVMFDKLVSLNIEIEKVDCEKADWSKTVVIATELEKYTDWRGDPQHTNIKGLKDHVERMNKGGSKVFCEIGKKTALGRIEAANSAWKGR
jgi:hypothetical protein